jgi:hypothetical protein
MSGRHASRVSTIGAALHQAINISGTAFKKSFVDMDFDGNCKPGFPWSWTELLSEIDARSQKVKPTYYINEW